MKAMDHDSLDYLEQIHLPPAPHPISIRKEHITPSQTIINIKQHDDAYLGRDFTIRDAYSGSKLFTVEGKSLSSSQRREFRDASGLPLFELRRRNFTAKNAWELNLPGGGHGHGNARRRSWTGRGGEDGDEEKILSTRLRWSWTRDKLDVTLKRGNATSSGAGTPPLPAEEDTKGRSEDKGAENGNEDITLEVRGQDPCHVTTHVNVGGRKIAHIRRVWGKGDLTVKNCPGHRSEWDAVVAEGVDLSLISVIVVMLAERITSTGHVPGSGSTNLMMHVDMS
ncbi:hypothetical protein VTN00DRAFT_8422 [Thermoascus crustaceus]|uniref:uncharacterized protein n=1 Tax=Thermoascus crustaceus TaxID=5088 RepID=UPI003743157A